MTRVGLIEVVASIYVYFYNFLASTKVLCTLKNVLFVSKFKVQIFYTRENKYDSITIETKESAHNLPKHCILNLPLVRFNDRKKIVLM